MGGGTSNCPASTPGTSEITAPRAIALTDFSRGMDIFSQYPTGFLRKINNSDHGWYAMASGMAFPGLIRFEGGSST
jgi:hypothetical protein